MARDLSWVPDRQISVLATLAHADTLIEQVGDLVLAHSRNALEIADFYENGFIHARVAVVHPLARAIASYTADALNTLRSAVEHSLFAEVTAAAERPLTPGEEWSVEMPATETPESFDEWVQKKRKAPPSLLARKMLDRIRTLQPYHRADPAEHPLRVLVAHTNMAKHRMPALTATRVSRVHAWRPTPGLTVPPPSRVPVEVGQVLASVPRDSRLSSTSSPRSASDALTPGSGSFWSRSSTTSPPGYVALRSPSSSPVRLTSSHRRPRSSPTWDIVTSAPRLPPARATLRSSAGAGGSRAR